MEIRTKYDPAMERSSLITTYHSKSYESYCILLERYAKKGYGVDYQLFFRYIISLVKIRRFDDAYAMVKKLEKCLDQFPDLAYDIFTFYIYCFKPQDAERIYNRGIPNIINKTYIVKMYLMQGKIDKARIAIHQIAKEQGGFDEELIRLNRQIFYHDNNDAFIEMEYQSFINNGNKLEPGHIVYLKDTPVSLNPIEEDYKNANRPYMIWKCVGEKIYLFPVSTSVKEKNFVLFKQKYRNSVGDRIVKSNLCSSTTDNIVSVADKVRDDDLKTVFKSIYESLYLSRGIGNRDANDEFLREFHKEVKPNQIMFVMDHNTREFKRYFVIDVKDEYYELIEVNKERNVCSDRIELFRKDRLFFKAITIPEESIMRYRSQLPENLENSSLLGAKVETYGRRYIVIGENGNNCLCIDALYSPSYINVDIIKREDIKDTYGFIDGEKVQGIIDMVRRNGKFNFDNMLRKLKKQKS